MSNGLSPGPQPQYFNEIEAIWPDLYSGQVNVAPARNGMDRYTGALLQGWPHVWQSITVIFMTPFSARVLRRWVGSFVPLLLGQNLVPRVVTRFWWAIMTALDLWEPDYKITRVMFMGNALSQQSPNMATTSVEAMIRAGQTIFAYQGVYYPRGHLGDFTPAQSAPPGPQPLALPSTTAGQGTVTYQTRAARRRWAHPARRGAATMRRR